MMTSWCCKYACGCDAFVVLWTTVDVYRVLQSIASASGCASVLPVEHVFFQSRGLSPLISLTARSYSR